MTMFMLGIAVGLLCGTVVMAIAITYQYGDKL